MSELPGGGAPHADQATEAPSSPLRPQETLGPYRLLQRLGEGGMGDVWLAEQTRPVRRQVAIKIIKAGMDTAQIVARFEAERQALAVMDHAAIARVFDAGATPQGRPYFVMEYVRGESITGYCQRHKLSTHDRIDLFLQVCDGVQHAHQKGIIHRDLKPSNILVTVQDDRPAPKIIDFGVAKATTQHLTERTLYTELGVLIGTPEYMSPEQAEMTGLDVDTRTDVYALGVLLYELLTGALPFDSMTLREKGLDEIRRTIREVDPPRPSIRLTTLAAGGATRERAGGITTAKELRGDLDWVTMRTLEKDRTRRYGSVSDLAADLRRHLDDLPVLAGPPSTVYRVRKFAVRHRFGVATAALLVTLLVVFAATAALQARRIARERDRANVERESAKQVADFLVGLFKVSDPGEAKGNTITAREILDKGARDIDQRLAEQPQVQARLQATFGTVYTNLGLYSAAEPLLQQAVSSERRLGADRPESLAAVNALANVYWYLGRYDEAEPLYRDLIDRRRRTLGSEHRDTLHAQYDLASLLTRQKRWDMAELLLRETLASQERKLGDADPDTLDSMGNLASYYYQRGQFSDALPINTRELELKTRSHGPDHPATLLATHNLATVYDALGRFDEAEPLYHQAIERQRRVLGDDHPQLANTRRRLAGMYLRQRRYDDAEREALAAYTHLLHRLGPHHIRTREVVDLVANIYAAEGKLGIAAEWRAKQPKAAAVTQAAR